MPFTAPAEELVDGQPKGFTAPDDEVVTKSGRGFTAPKDEIVQPPQLNLYPNFGGDPKKLTAANQRFSEPVAEPVTGLFPYAEPLLEGKPLEAAKSFAGNMLSGGFAAPVIEPIVSYAGHVARGAVADAATLASGGSKDLTDPRSNILSALKGETRLPIDQAIEDAEAQGANVAGTVARISNGLSASLPIILGTAALPVGVQNAIGKAFIGKMVIDDAATAKDLYDELQKPVEQRDQSKINQLLADAATNTGFLGLAGYAAAKGDVPSKTETKGENPKPVNPETATVTPGVEAVAKEPTIKSAPTDSSSIVDADAVRKTVVESAKKEIEAQIASGEIPQTVSSFPELHDYVDANNYVTDKAEIGALGKSKGWKQNDYADFTNGVINELDAWLKDRAEKQSNAGGQASEAASQPVKPSASPVPSSQELANKVRSFKIGDDAQPQNPTETATSIVATGKPNGATAEVKYEVVDASQLEPLVARQINDIQTRQRAGNVASDEQISKISTNPDINHLSESPVSTIGAPIIDNDNIVAGNGRAAGLVMHYSGEGAKYRQGVIDAANRLGLGDVSNIKRPVLIRRVIRYLNGDQRSFVVESNPRQQALRETQSEAAMLDAEALGDTSALNYTEAGTLSADSVRQVAARLESAQRGVARTSDGRFDGAEATRRVQLAALAKIAHDNKIPFQDFAGLIEGDTGKRLATEVIRAAPRLANLDSDLNIGRNLLAALQEIRSGIAAVGNGDVNSLDEWLVNRGNELFSAESPQAEEMLKDFVAGQKNPSKLRKVLNEYQRLAEEEQQRRTESRETGDIFGSQRKGVTGPEIFNRARSEAAGQSLETGSGERGGTSQVDLLRDEPTKSKSEGSEVSGRESTDSASQRDTVDRREQVSPAATGSPEPSGALEVAAKIVEAGGSIKSAIDAALAHLRENSNDFNESKSLENLNHIFGNVDSVKDEAGKIVGMGGATPSEFDPINKSPTAMKYKLIDRERVERGLDPLTKPESVPDKVAFAKAEAAFDNDPEVGANLVRDILSGKRKTIEDWENHVLLLQKIGVRDQYYKSARESAQAYEDGRLDDMQEANVRTAEWADKLHDVEQASRISGSARGRALRSLQVMANEDMSLASLEMQKRAAKGGAPLTANERAQLQKVADDYKARLDAYEKHQAEREQQIKDDAFKEAFDRISKQPSNQPKYHPKVLERAEQLVAKLEAKAQTALKDVLGTTWSPGPEVLGKMALVGAAKLARGVLEVSKWTDAMVRDLGERFRPYANQVFEMANKELEKQLGASAKVVRDKGDLNQQRDTIGARITEKVTAGKKNELSGLVQRLARVLYQQGFKTREGLLTALHDTLEPSGMTRREVADAFSGYGEFKQLSKDQITIALRGMKGELQQLAKLEDMAAGKPPLKSGLERREPTDAERELIKKVNDAKNKFQIPISDPSTQLKSALDTLKTTLANRIKDYERRLADKDFAPRPRRELVLDSQALKLKADAERVRTQFRQALRQEQLKNRPIWEKAFEQTAGIARFSALSGYHTLGKLFSYTLAKLAEIPLIESTGAGLSKVPGLRPIFERANLESGSTGKSLAALYSGVAIKGLKAAAQVLRTGSTDAKTVHGKVNIEPPRWYDFFGTLHAAEKAPLQTGSMEMYVRRATENAIKAGLDPRDEFVRAQINKEAYDYSQRDILMENNKFSEAIKMLHKRLEQADPKTGQVDVANAIVSTLAKTFLTKGIVRTPANYIAQTIARTPIGFATGLLKTGMAHYRGIGSLKPAEANAVARLLKVGAVGSAFFLLGMIDATKPEDERTFGGYWEPGRKRGGDDVEWGKIRLFGKQLPHVVTHNPLTESAQMGSTMMRVALARLKKDSPENKGLAAGAMKALVGLASKAPVSSPLMRLGEGRANVTGDLVKGLVPQLLQNIAEDTDDMERNPQNALEQLETAVPGLRQNVPEKVKKVR